MSPGPQFGDVLQRALAHNRPVARGRVAALSGVLVEAVGMRCASGDRCTIHTQRGEVGAEVVGFRDGVTLLMPTDNLPGVAPFDPVVGHAEPFVVPTGDQLLGRVVDAFGAPLDGGPPIRGIDRPVVAAAPHALSRAPVVEPLQTGVSAIDGLITIGRGQRLGVFAGSGVGKSTLLGMIARSGMGDVNVIALIGERGREVRDFIDQVLGPEGMQRSVVVVATSDSAPMARFKGPFTAVTIAEAFRDQGRNVMFMMDSVTRFAGASREIGLAAGEPPTLRGYPPSLFAHLPRLVERLGNDDRGSITGVLTVLVDGDDMNEPVSDAVRGYLDGHLVLSRAIAARGHFPAIDVLASVSRLMPEVTDVEHRRWAVGLRRLLAHYEEHRDLVQVGAYQRGADPLLDAAIAKLPAIEQLIYPGSELRPVADTLVRMRDIVDGPNGG